MFVIWVWEQYPPPPPPPLHLARPASESDETMNAVNDLRRGEHTLRPPTRRHGKNDAAGIHRAGRRHSSRRPVRHQRHNYLIAKLPSCLNRWRGNRINDSGRTMVNIQRRCPSPIRDTIVACGWELLGPFVHKVR